MASSLTEFLQINPDEYRTRTMTVKAKDGRDVDVEVKGLSLSQFQRIKVASTYSYSNAQGGQGVAQVEELSFSQQLCAAGIVDPPLTSSQLKSHFKAHTTKDLVEKMFSAPAISQMGAAIATLTLEDKEDVELTAGSGVDEKLLEEAKN